MRVGTRGWRTLNLSLVGAVLALVGGGAGLAPRLAAAPEASRAACASDAAYTAELSARLDGVLADPRLWGARLGVVVRSGETGQVLYSRSGEQRLIPASNQKLVIAAAALDTLGPDSRPGPGGETLAELLVPLLKLSDNGIADRLLGAIGPSAVTGYLDRIGVDPERVVLHDGSGVSDANQIAAEDLTRVLFAAQSEDWFAPLYAALPVAGGREPLVGGTLRTRMLGTPAQDNVHAKTGTLANVSALSGYVTSGCGEPLVFSVLINDFHGPPPKQVEDRLAAVLAQ
jgi:D-alanyl-D-alanine carboxypeptidase